MKFWLVCPMIYWPDYVANLLYFRGKPDAIKRAQTATWQVWAINEAHKNGKD